MAARRSIPPAGDHLDPVPDLERRILHEQDGVVVIDKPPALPTSGRALDDPDCLQFWMMQRARRMVWAVHQLDADTTGVNVFVTRKSLVPTWQERLRFPVARKEYLAIVHGRFDWTRRRVDGAIGFIDGPDWKGWAVDPGGRPAATRFEVLAEGPEHSAVVCTLETGRTHQIRVHLRHLGTSLVGEEWYRDQPCTEHPRQALHARRIRFTDDAEPAELVAPVPDDLLDLADRLGIGIGSARPIG